MSKNSSFIAILAIILAGLGLTLASFTTLFLSNQNTTQNSDDLSVYYCSAGEDLQDIIDAIGSGNGIIIITENITISERIDIDGGGAYIFQGAGLVTINMVINMSGMAYGFNITRASSCTFRDLAMNASSSVAGVFYLVRIDEVNGNPIFMQNIYFSANNISRALWIRSNNVHVQNCVFRNFSDGIYCSNSPSVQNCHFTDNSFENMAGAGIYVYNTISCTVQGNSFNMCGSGITFSWSYSSTIMGNAINDVGFSGIYIHNSQQITVTGNTIKDLDPSFAYPGDVYGIYSYGSDYNTYTGNTVLGIQSVSYVGYGMYLNMGSDENSVVGNHFYNNDDNNINDNGLNNYLVGNKEGTPSPEPETIARFARNTVTSTLAEETEIEVDFNYEEYDPGNNFNPSTNAYTVPISGNYLITGAITFNNGNDGDNVWVRVAVNGIVETTQIGTFAESGTLAYMSVNVNALLNLDAGDSVTIVIRLPTANTGSMRIYGTSSATHTAVSIAMI